MQGEARQTTTLRAADAYAALHIEQDAWDAPAILLWAWWDAPTALRGLNTWTESRPRWLVAVPSILCDALPAWLPATIDAVARPQVVDLPCGTRVLIGGAV